MISRSALFYSLTFCQSLFLRFRGVSIVLSIRELGVWDDLQVHHHGGGQGLAGADGHHLRRRHLQGDHHHHNHHHSGALYLQLLGRQRCRGGFLDRHCSRSGLTQCACSGATHTEMTALFVNCTKKYISDTVNLWFSYSVLHTDR